MNYEQLFYINIPTPFKAFTKINLPEVGRTAYTGSLVYLSRVFKVWPHQPDPVTTRRGSFPEPVTAGDLQS